MGVKVSQISLERGKLVTLLYPSIIGFVVIGMIILNWLIKSDNQFQNSNPNRPLNYSLLNNMCWYLTSFGDKDLDLRQANPLHLRNVLEDHRFLDCQIVLLHASYPFSREASYLASVYEQVEFWDLKGQFSNSNADVKSMSLISYILAHNRSGTINFRCTLILVLLFQNSVSMAWYHQWKNFWSSHH